MNHGRLDLGFDLVDTSGGSVDGTSGGGWSVVAHGSERVSSACTVESRHLQGEKFMGTACRCALSSLERPSSRSQETSRAPGSSIHFASFIRPLHLPTSLSLPAVNSHPHLSHSTLSTMNAALLQQIQRKYSSPVHSAALTLSQRARVSRRLRSTTGPRRRWPAAWAVLPLPVPAPMLVPMPHPARQRPPCRVGMTRRRSSQDSLPVACPP